MILFESVTQKYNDRIVLQSINLDLSAGQTHVFIGSSGSGKSTLLRLICGLINLTSGKLTINGQEVSTLVQTSLAHQIGYVIQEGGLFPHFTARENVSIGALNQKWGAKKIASRITELAQLVQLEEALLDSYPNRLSGGQRQRVALMRALFVDPSIILLDEPLGALDPLIRSDLQQELKKIFNQLKKTVIWVTHDINEAAFFGDTISLFHEGRLLQHGNFLSFVKQPTNEFVSKFIKAQTPSAELMELLR